MELPVALVGYGYWGPNLARAINHHPDAVLTGIVDTDKLRRDKAKNEYPYIPVCVRIAEVIERSPETRAVAIATPPETHFGVASVAIRRSLHVLIEKPMTLSSSVAEELLVRAASAKRTVMVDHVYCYSPAARKIKQLIDKGEIGDLLYVDSTRINLGLFQRDCDVIWDLAVHDFALLDYFFPELQPRSVAARGPKHYTAWHDTAHIAVDYHDTEAQAHIHVSWLSPVKIRQMIIAGTEKSIVWNDMDPVEPVKVYDRGAVFSAEADPRDPGRAWQMQYRRGDIWVPVVSTAEALSCVIGEFVTSIEDKRKPMTDGCAGRRVVNLVHQASLSARANGRAREFSKEPRPC